MGDMPQTDIQRFFQDNKGDVTIILNNKSFDSFMALSGVCKPQKPYHKGVVGKFLGCEVILKEELE